MPNPLTKSAKVTAEQQRVSKLTKPHDTYFKAIFSHQVAKKYKFSSLYSNSEKQLTPAEQAKVFKAFGLFLDKATKLTITEVEDIFGRVPDRRDGTFDPETGQKVEVRHLCFYKEGDPPRGHSDSVRIHGYFRANGGYFVVTKLDWFHEVHKK